MKNISKVVSNYVKEVDRWRINTGYTRYLSGSSLEVEQELLMCLGMSQNVCKFGGPQAEFRQIYYSRGIS